MRIAFRCDTSVLARRFYASASITKRPGERSNHFEFLLTAQYRSDAQDSNPLCDEIAGLMMEARRSGRFDLVDASAFDRPATV